MRKVTYWHKHLTKPYKPMESIGLQLQENNLYIIMNQGTYGCFQASS